MTTTPVPTYRLRGLDILGFGSQEEFLDELFADGRVKTGLMIAFNAEKVVVCDRDPALRRIAEQAAYTYADGISVVRSIRRKYADGLPRIAGIDLWQAMMSRAGRERIPVFLLGARAEVLTEVERRLKDEWGVDVVGGQDGYFDDDQRDAIFERIRRSGAAIVTVALGSPAQEIFMHECHQVYPGALYMGVGGTFDVVAGYVKRAPAGWRRANLEWLYRLLSRPARLRRSGRLVVYAFYHFTNRL
ncbi:lipopolysaccharide N-acetylmannosaminouronosyltransferase [Streptosporangium sp. NPDC002524]|uniref:lipopolysaccharide N-acetylmannosaminouronosyltransferase n=1 Tax=Streptosporangium sp. NPDC002524 TaxID=3154537 RepID=UPI00332469F5